MQYYTFFILLGLFSGSKEEDGVEVPFTNGDRRVVGIHTPEIPDGVKLNPRTIYFLDLGFKTPITVKHDFLISFTNRYLLPYEFTVDSNNVLGIKPLADEFSCLHNSFYLAAIDTHYYRYPVPNSTWVAPWEGECAPPYIHWFNKMYKPDRFALTLKNMMEMMIKNDFPVLSVIEGHLLYCLLIDDNNRADLTPRDDLTGVLYQNVFNVHNRVHKKPRWFYLDVSILGAVSSACPMSYIIDKPHPAASPYITFNDRLKDPGPLTEDIVPIPDNYRLLVDLPRDTLFNGTTNTYTLVAANLRGIPLTFQHHEDVWAPSITVYSKDLQCHTYQLTLTFFGVHQCSVRIKARGNVVEVSFPVGNKFEAKKPVKNIFMPFVRLFLEDGTLRIYFENAPTFYVGRFCPDHVHFVNTLTEMQVKMKQVLGACEDSLLITLGDEVRLIEEIWPTTKPYNRTEDEYYDTDYDDVTTSTASFEPWYVAAGVAVLLLILFGLSAFLGKRYIDNMEYQS